jgi:ferredoxin
MDELVEVRFEPDARTVWVSPGTTLLAAATAAGVDILTGCTRGMCGTDPVRVDVDGVRGALDAPAEHEKGTLERMGLSADFRLSCAARVRHGLVTVHLGAY